MSVALLLFAAFTQTHPVGWCMFKPNDPHVETACLYRLKLTYDELLWSFAFNCNLRHYNPVLTSGIIAVGRYRLPVSKPVLKARPVSALETKI